MRMNYSDKQVKMYTVLFQHQLFFGINLQSNLLIIFLTKTNTFFSFFDFKLAIS